MHEFNQSLKYDRRMYDADVRGSVAYAKALSRAGILTQEEVGKIIHGLSAVGKEWMDGIVSSGGTTNFHVPSTYLHSLSSR
jgi:argininosuccinate lyase